ncbi:MAG: hypothetical protein KJO01_12570 [Gammaproteobacteria bacterium]|nr:hypothetical protein [Gammaproteobacteria bacterium]NND46035.1 hypothetical protein [Woeseiaceae bacterium]
MSEDKPQHAAMVVYEMASKGRGNPGLLSFLNELEQECRDILSSYVDTTDLEDTSKFLSKNAISGLPGRAQDAFFCACMVYGTRDALSNCTSGSISDGLAYELFTLGAAAQSAKIGSSFSTARKVRTGFDKGIAKMNALRKETAAEEEAAILGEFRKMLDKGIQPRKLVSNYRKAHSGYSPSESKLRRIKKKL